MFKTFIQVVLRVMLKTNYMSVIIFKSTLQSVFLKVNKSELRPFITNTFVMEEGF